MSRPESDAEGSAVRTLLHHIAWTVVGIVALAGVVWIVVTDAIPMNEKALLFVRFMLFVFAVAAQVCMLGVLRWGIAQPLALPFFDTILVLEQRAKDGDGLAAIAVAIVHAVVTAAIIIGAAMMSGVAH